jgi:hypothetical protein
LYFSFCLRAYASALPSNVAGLVFWTVGMWLLLFFFVVAWQETAHTQMEPPLPVVCCEVSLHLRHTYCVVLSNYPLHGDTQNASHTHPAFFPHTNSTVPWTVSASASDVALLKPPHKIN